MTINPEFEQCAVMWETAGNEMLARLSWLTLAPKTIVYLGAPLDSVLAVLQERYPTAEIHCHDGSVELPYDDQSVDMIFANLFLPYVSDDKAFIRAARRVLREEGVLMLSAFGIDTLQEARALQPSLATPRIVDLHDVGDLLTMERFADPVMEVDHWRVAYDCADKLKHELKVTSMCLPEELEALTLTDAALTVTYEIVFGHAFAPGKQTSFGSDDNGEVRVPVSSLLSKKSGKTEVGSLS